MSVLRIEKNPFSWTKNLSEVTDEIQNPEQISSPNTGILNWISSILSSLASRIAKIVKGIFKENISQNAQSMTLKDHVMHFFTGTCFAGSIKVTPRPTNLDLSQFKTLKGRVSS